MIDNYLESQGFQIKSLANYESGDLQIFSPNIKEWYIRHRSFSFCTRLHSLTQMKRLINRYKMWEAKRKV